MNVDIVVEAWICWSDDEGEWDIIVSIVLYIYTLLRLLLLDVVCETL